MPSWSTDYKQCIFFSNKPQEVYLKILKLPFSICYFCIKYFTSSLFPLHSDTFSFLGFFGQGRKWHVWLYSFPFVSSNCIFLSSNSFVTLSCEKCLFLVVYGECILRMATIVIIVIFIPFCMWLLLGKHDSLQFVHWNIIYTI